MTILTGATISTMTNTMTTLISRAGEVTGVDLDFENRMVSDFNGENMTMFPLLPMPA